MTAQERPEAEDDERYDPFEAFERAMGVGAVRNPYPRFAELRRLGPVHRGSAWELMGLRDPMVTSRGETFYTAFTYDAVVAILRDAETFSSTIHARSMGQVMGHSILGMDDPEHKRYRSLVEQAFTRRAMERWERELIGPVVNAFIDRFADRGRADLVREFAFPFPMHVITALLGLPEEDLSAFHRWAFQITNMADFERALAASRKLHDFFVRIIGRRREEPAGDLISALAAAELDGQRLDDEEIIAFLRLLLPAGGETTYHSSSNLLFGLLTRPEQLEALRRDRSLVPQAVEEGLRWEPPLTYIPRLATRDAEIGGVKIPEGTVVTLCVGSAGHDESRWENPEEFDIFRPQHPHVAFAFGPHTCLGMHLARVETAVALNALFDRLPNLRLDPAWDDPHIAGLVFRSPRALPVLFG